MGMAESGKTGLQIPAKPNKPSMNLSYKYRLRACVSFFCA
jgi:hypothetical protein